MLVIVNGILQNLYRLQTLDLSGSRAKSSEAAALRAGIPAAMLTNYDRMRARGKKGIAVVRNHVCSNCRMRMPVGVTAALMRGTVSQVCGNCGLYLCLPEPEEAVEMKPVVVAEPKKRKRKSMATSNLLAT